MVKLFYMILYREIGRSLLIITTLQKIERYQFYFYFNKLLIINKLCLLDYIRIN